MSFKKNVSEVIPKFDLLLHEHNNESKV